MDKDAGTFPIHEVAPVMIATLLMILPMLCSPLALRRFYLAYDDPKSKPSQGLFKAYSHLTRSLYSQ